MESTNAIARLTDQPALDSVAKPLSRAVRGLYSSAGEAGRLAKNAAHGVWLVRTGVDGLCGCARHGVPRRRSRLRPAHRRHARGGGGARVVHAGRGQYGSARQLDEARAPGRRRPAARAPARPGLGARASVRAPRRTDAPFAPKGCPFQAWSLGELVRLEHDICPPVDDAGASSGSSRARTDAADSRGDQRRLTTTHAR